MDLIKSIKSILRQALTSHDKAYLFGSRARGTAGANSDWDILIVIDKEKIEKSDYDRISYPLNELGWDSDEIISPIIYTRAEWERQSITPFFKNVENDAILLT